jgi:hypothetical protein
VDQPDLHLAPVGSVVVPGPLTSPWLFVHDDARPHLHPVTTPAGHVLTCDAPADHPWHHGLWFTIKYVDGDNFWEQMGGEGDLRVTSPPMAVELESGPTLFCTIDWVRPASDVVALVETLTITAVVPADPSWSVVDIAVTLSSDRDVVLDRTPYTTWGGYGGLTFRGRGDLVDSRFLLADRSTAAKLTGTRAPWVDLTGTIPDPGHHTTVATVGLAMLDGTSPGDRPVPWYGSTRSAVYGTEGWSNFLNAAFLWNGPLTLTAGEPLDFRYRVIAHDGAVDAPALDAELARYRASLDPA